MKPLTNFWTSPKKEHEITTKSIQKIKSAGKVKSEGKSVDDEKRNREGNSTDSLTSATTGWYH